MRPRLSAVALLLPLACTDDDGGRTTAADTIITTAASMTATTASMTTTASTGAPDPDTTDPTTTTPDPTSTTTTTTPTTTPQTTTDDPATSDPSHTTTTADTTTTPGTTTGDPDPLACPPELPQDCDPGPGSGEPDTCNKATSCFLETIKQGVKDVIAAHPEWFTDEGGGTYLVLDVEAYMNAVVADINENPLCAIRDPNAGDEVAVKHDNGYAESFDILTADNKARYGDLIYTATCAPAWF